MDVERHAIDVAVIRAGVEELGGTDDVLPVFLLGEIGQVGHQAGFDEFFRVTARVELGCAHRIAAENTADDQRGGGRARTGDGAVDPVIVTQSVVLISKNFDCGGFATRCPPMRYFEICRICRKSRNRDGCEHSCGHQTKIHEFSSLTETLPEKRSLIIFGAQLAARKIFFIAQIYDFRLHLFH